MIKEAWNGLSHRFFRVDWWLSVELSYLPEFCLDFLSPPKLDMTYISDRTFIMVPPFVGLFYHDFLNWYSCWYVTVLARGRTHRDPRWCGGRFRPSGPWRLYGAPQRLAASGAGEVFQQERFVFLRALWIIVPSIISHWGLSFVICDWFGMVGEKFCVKYEFKVNGANNDRLSALLRHQFASFFWNISTASRLKLEIDIIENVLC